jgi:hypothetical protein
VSFSYPAVWAISNASFNFSISAWKLKKIGISWLNIIRRLRRFTQILKPKLKISLQIRPGGGYLGVGF